MIEYLIGVGLLCLIVAGIVVLFTIVTRLD